MIDDDFVCRRRKEVADARAAARSFVKACASGDPELMLQAIDGFSNTVDGWREAMRGAGKLTSVTPEIQAAFLDVWIQHKMLPNTVGSRTILARALLILLPRRKTDTPLLVYRGASIRERVSRAYGFSWTTQIGVARIFAERWRKLAGGVIFETLASPETILVVRTAQTFYDEGEVIVDPFALGRVRTFEMLVRT